MIKTGGLFLGLAVVVISLTFAGCTDKKAGEEMAPDAEVEAPAAEATEEAPMAPAEGEEGAAADTPEGDEAPAAEMPAADEASEAEEGK